MYFNIQTEVLLPGAVHRDEGSLYGIMDGEGRFQYDYFTAVDDKTLMVESVRNEAYPDTKVVYKGDAINRAEITESDRVRGDYLDLRWYMFIKPN